MKQYSLLRSMLDHPELSQMKDYRQHQNTNTYTHCRHVTLMSLWIIRRFRIPADVEAVIRAAMLHDFYLYDAMGEGVSAWRHGRQHPAIALKNAEKHFQLSWKEKNIIYSHMWPIHFSHVPLCREAVIVNAADKICAVEEMFLWNQDSHLSVAQIGELLRKGAGYGKWRRKTG